jgi:hypothetical protein
MRHRIARHRRPSEGRGDVECEPLLLFELPMREGAQPEHHEQSSGQQSEKRAPPT